jgi:hypothetical protein
VPKIAKFLPLVFAPTIALIAGCSTRTAVFQIAADHTKFGLEASIGPRLAVSVTVTVVLSLVGATVYYRSRWRKSERARKEAPGIIYSAIYAKLDIALRATGPGAITAAQDLCDVIELYLGPLLTFSTDLNRLLEQLKKALKGKIKQTTTTTITTGPEHGLSIAAASAAASSAGGASAASASAGGAHVTVTAPPPANPPAPAASERDASTREQMIEVRVALEGFAAFWTRAVVVEKLRRAQRALLISAPICAPDHIEDPCASTPEGATRKR